MLSLEIFYGSLLPSLAMLVSRSKSDFPFPGKNFDVCVSKWARERKSASEYGKLKTNIFF